MNLDDTVELIYREGDPVPSSAGVFDEFSLPAANIDGDAIVLAGGNAFVSRPGSPLELILATGQLLEVAPGDFRSVSSVFGHHTASEHHLNRRGFNNDGDAVFRLRFSDGDEAVVRTNVNAPVVPVLPVGTWLLGMALLGASGVGLVRRRASA